MKHHPFAMFGLPFILTIVAGSFFLTPAQALRYETYDKKVQKVSKEEQLGIKKGRRRVDMNEEYYVYIPPFGREGKKEEEQKHSGLLFFLLSFHFSIPFGYPIFY